MEIKSLNKFGFHVELSPTEKKVLADIASQKKETVEKTFATLSFGAIMAESAQLKLSKKIAEHEFWWEGI